MGDILPAAGGAEIGHLARPTEIAPFIEEGADHHLIIIEAPAPHPQIFAARHRAGRARAVGKDVGPRHLPRIARRIRRQRPVPGERGQAPATALVIMHAQDHVLQQPIVAIGLFHAILFGRAGRVPRRRSLSLATENPQHHGGRRNGQPPFPPAHRFCSFDPIARASPPARPVRNAMLRLNARSCEAGMNSPVQAIACPRHSDETGRSFAESICQRRCAADAPSTSLTRRTT